MGKTVESFRMALENEIGRWNGFARALRRPDREALDELMDMCRSYASAGSCATNPIVFEPMVMSVLLAQQVRIRELERKIDALKLGEGSLVKIQTRTATKKYLSKTYSYKQNIVCLPLTCNEALAPFLDQQLDLDIKDGTIVLAIKKPLETER